MSIHYLAENLYQVRVRGRKRPDGTRPSVTKTVHGTETAAKRVERDLLTQRDKGLLQGGAMKLRDYCDVWYAESIRRGAPKTHELNAYLIDVHIVKRLGDLRLDAITAKHIRDFYADISETLSGTSARKASNLLTQILDQAVMDDQIAQNPCRRLRVQDRPQVDTEEKAALDSDAVHGLLDALGKTERGLLVRDVTLFMLGTGARPGEALALGWGDVDLKTSVVRLRKSLEKVTGSAPRLKETKTRRGMRDVPLPDAVVAMLTEHRAAQRRLRLKTKNWRDHGFVFPSVDPRRDPGGPWTVGALRQAWRRALAGTPFAAYSPYVCRHTYATSLRDRVADEELSRLLGHATSAVLRGTYSHVRPETMQQARELIAGLL